MTRTINMTRRLSAGAELQPGGGAHVRVWAPACQRVELVTPGATPGDPEHAIAMVRDPDGCWSAFDPVARAGGRYWFRLDGERLRPDPVSRSQPEGPHRPSQYIDPSAFRWSDAGWPGVSRDRQVIYEMHIGTFTRDGTWMAAATQLDELARIGITIVEMMPIADFGGGFGWGYDGVDLYAPSRLYGTPDDLRAFVDRAHALGLGVILDVVYNHLGPDGNYLSEFSPDYFTTKYSNDWGQSINFEGSAPAREFFVQNAAYWIDEYHFDGLRLDATQDIHDSSREHVLAAIARAARDAAGHRSVMIVAENEPQETRLVRPPDRGGYGLDALWNDDAHHAAYVAVTGRREAYYTDYTGSPQELVSCARWGYLYQGQWYAWQKKRRGTPALDLTADRFVVYLENHDQVANSAFGRRLHQMTSPALHRAMTAWLLLGPSTPLLFQGQEFSSSKPFLFFADHDETLAAAVREGRREFLSQFASTADRGVQERLPPPAAKETFAACVLDFGERERHRASYALHCDLLKIRREDAVIAAGGRNRPEGAVLGSSAFLLRYLDADHGDRLLVVNLGGDLDLSPLHEPLLASPEGSRWRLVWSSASPEYDGSGTAPLDTDGAWRLQAECALLFAPETRA
jgi:maltooligosyltrehalose trehalohydrolase